MYENAKIYMTTNMCVTTFVGSWWSHINMCMQPLLQVGGPTQKCAGQRLLQVVTSWYADVTVLIAEHLMLLRVMMDIIATES